jgi:hypothetical protein
MNERTALAAKSLEHRLKQVQKKKYFDLAAFFGRPNADLKMFDGDILLLVGGSGANKTTIMQNMVHELGEPTLYVSPEVYDHLFYRRQLQIITGLSKHEVLSNYKYLFQEYHKELDLVHLMCKGINEVSLQETLADLSLTMGIKNIVLDHMKLMDLQGDFTRRAEEFVAWLKPFASARGIKVFMVSQVPKSAMMPNYSTGKTRELEIYDAAGASGLYQIADIAMTINAPTGINEPIRYVSFGKARDGEAYKVTGVPMKLEVNSMRMVPLRPDEELMLKQERVERLNEKIIK